MAVAVAAPLVACSGGSGADRAAPFPLPTDSGLPGSYLRACLSPDGMVRGFLAADVDPSTVTTVLRCIADPARKAVRVDVARGDATSLVSSLRVGDDAALGDPRRTTYVILTREGALHAVTPAAEVPAEVVRAAGFAPVGTTARGSLGG